MSPRLAAFFGALNDAGRRLVALGVVWLGLLLELWHRAHLVLAPRLEARLRRRYGLAADTPVVTFGAELQARIDAAAAQRPDARFAVTSGTTATPKRLLYDRRRLLEVKLAYSAAVARLCALQDIPRTCLYVFRSYERDASLTSLLVEEKRRPSYLSSLQAPYRLEDELAELRREHGATAARLLVLTLASPGLLYATNPSTLSTFFDGLPAAWPEVRAIARRALTDRALAPVVRRLLSRGAHGRLVRMAGAPAPLPVTDLLPHLTHYITWTGGYVQPFLERLARHLPSPRYVRVPMFSMSTEVLETVPHYTARSARFLPLAAGVVYELLPEGGA